MLQIAGSQRLTLVAVIALIVVTSSPSYVAAQNEAGLGSRRRAWPKEQDDDPPAETRTKYTNPRDVPWLHEGDIFKYRKQFDVFAVLVIQPYVCPKCVVGHEALMKARNTILHDETGHLHHLLPSNSIGFGVLDADDEAPEFISLFEDANEDNYRTRIPCLLVFKQYHQDTLKKPPILFTYSEVNLKEKLAPFLVRLVGVDIAPVSNEEQLMTRIASPYANRVSVVVWADEPTKVQRQLAIEGRIDTLWSIVDRAEARYILSPKFNPDHHDIVVYFYRGQLGADHIPDVLNGELDDVLEMQGISFNKLLENETKKFRRDDRERRATKDLLEEMLAQRPGQEFELVRRPTIIEDFIPEGCGPSSDDDGAPALRTSRNGDNLKINLVGNVVGPGETFAETLNSVITVGSSRADFPDVLLGEGLEGLCVGSRRRMGMPARQVYAEDMLPPGVSPEARIVFSITVEAFDDGSSSLHTGGGAILTPSVPKGASDDDDKEEF
jgi:hypothetical protein